MQSVSNNLWHLAAISVRILKGKKYSAWSFERQKKTSTFLLLRPPVPLFSQVVKWSDCCLPLACRPGDPYRLIAEASVDNFSKLGVAFMEDKLQMDNGLIPQKIVCE
jgi:hypothetical protein